MGILKNRVVAILAFILSMPFQLLTRQVFYISLIVFCVFLLGNILYLWAKKESIKNLFNDPVLKSLALFLAGASTIAAFTFCVTTLSEKQNSMEREELFTEYISQRIVCDMAIKQLEVENKEPSYEWLDSMGVVNTNSLYDLICGVYYGTENHLSCNYKKARDYLSKAAETNPSAAYLYGECVYLGLGDIPDRPRGIEFINMAAEKQVIEAQYRLLGISVLSNNLREAEKWYSRIVYANTKDSVDIRFNNTNLINREDSNRVSQNGEAIKENLLHWYNMSIDSFDLMCALQIKEKKPFAAICLCEDYLSKTPWCKKGKNKQKIRAFLDRVKFTILMETGNRVQAKHIADKHDYGSRFPRKEDLELDLEFPLLITFSLN